MMKLGSSKTIIIQIMSEAKAARGADALTVTQHRFGEQTRPGDALQPEV